MQLALNLAQVIVLIGMIYVVFVRSFIVLRDTLSGSKRLAFHSLATHLRLAAVWGAFYMLLYR